MAGVRQLRQGGFDVIPAPFVLKSAPDQFQDEGAPTAGTGTPVEFGNQRIRQSYVYSHGPTLAHAGCVVGRKDDLPRSSVRAKDISCRPGASSKSVPSTHRMTAAEIDFDARSGETLCRRYRDLASARVRIRMRLTYRLRRCFKQMAAALAPNLARFARRYAQCPATRRAFDDRPQCLPRCRPVCRFDPRNSTSLPREAGAPYRLRAARYALSAAHRRQEDTFRGVPLESVA